MKKRIVALMCIFVMLTGILTSCGGAAKPKVFSKAGMSITLTEAFTEKVNEEMTAYYESKYVIATCLKEEYASFGITEDFMTLDEYADTVIEVNNITADVVNEDDLTYFRYDKTVEGGDASYLGFVYKTSDAFWLIQFGCETKFFEKDTELFKNVGEISDL